MFFIKLNCDCFRTKHNEKNYSANYSALFWGDPFPKPFHFCAPSKNQLHEEHIADRSAGNGQEHLLFPHVEPHGHSDGNELRQAMTALQIDTFRRQ